MHGVIKGCRFWFFIEEYEWHFLFTVIFETHYSLKFGPIFDDSVHDLGKSWKNRLKGHFWSVVHRVECASWNSNVKLYLTSSSGSGKGFGTQTRNLEICALLQILGKRVGETGQVTVLVRFWVSDQNVWVLDTALAAESSLVFFGCIADTWH